MTPELSGVKLFIFDADGTLRWTTVPGRRYPARECAVAADARRCRAPARDPWGPDGPWLAIASNQNGVAAGELSEAHARSLIEEMLQAALGHIPAETEIALCTCDERAQCACRKPAPGLLLRLLRHFRVAPEDALFVGDLDSDAEAARRAGVAFMWAGQFLRRMPTGKGP